jgi:hypothetical protein
MNKRVLFVARPRGEPDDSCFRLEEVAVPALQAGQILVKTLWLSVDPYMRGRMNDVKSYAAPMRVGDIMIGESAGVVLQSRSPSYAVGDQVTVHQGWQSMIVAQEGKAQLMKSDPRDGTAQEHLGVVGMPGRTAYFGLLEVGKPKPGETLVVAAASGAVGSVVGQLAKIKGLRAVGIAGSAEKCRYVTEELGFDACIDYHNADLPAELRAACPQGIDIYFENVGGAVTQAVAPLLNAGARVPICGYISKHCLAYQSTAFSW